MYMHVVDYEVISHQETPECSLRLLNLTKDKGVHLYHHHKTTQIYFVLEVTARATVARKSAVLKPYQILRIPRDALHDIRTDGEALVLSISVPPLDASDQNMAMEHREG
jgi:mannose-6-phosphate isomerase-like protein (cupin superfamily)